MSLEIPPKHQANLFNSPLMIRSLLPLNLVTLLIGGGMIIQMVRMIVTVVAINTIILTTMTPSIMKHVPLHQHLQTKPSTFLNVLMSTADAYRREMKILFRTRFRNLLRAKAHSGRFSSLLAKNWVGRGRRVRDGDDS